MNRGAAAVIPFPHPPVVLLHHAQACGQRRVKPAHMLLPAGWTPRIGNFYVLLHVFFIPDVDGQHRTGITLGVNWD